MACFIVPAAEAIVVTATYFAVKKKEQKIEAPKLGESSSVIEKSVKLSWSRKLSWLLQMLWGGVLLLVFDHIWNGEIVPYAPFLTALSSKADTMQMLYEMATLGVLMSVAVTAVWGAICVIADLKVKKLKAHKVKE